MSPDVQIIVVFALFLVLLAGGMAVPFAIAVPAMFYLLLQGGLPSLNSLGLVSWGSMNSFVLTCVPLFMLMAEILRVSGLSSRIYGGLAKLVARLPGGFLLQTNIAGCAIFAFTGESARAFATAASIGGVALPQLLRRNYDRRLAAGSPSAAGGTLGILLPPSFGMIVYGTFIEQDLGAEAVHGRPRARPDHDGGVHDLYRRACAVVVHRRRAARGGRAAAARASCDRARRRAAVRAA